MPRLHFLLLLVSVATAARTHKGNEKCCSILKKYPDMIPHQKWGNGITDSEKKKWDGESCNDRVGGSSKALCTDDDRCFEVKLTTVSYGSEISWSLGSCQGNGGYGNNGEYTEQCCLEPGNYNLECKDSYGDGWHGGYIEVNGEKYCESFSSGSEETSQIIIEGNGLTHTDKEQADGSSNENDVDDDDDDDELV